MRRRVAGADGWTKEEREELQRLQRENRRLKRENAFLKSGGLVRAGDPVGRYRLMRAEQAGMSVRAMAGLLGVSRSGYYAWRDRGPSPRAQADERLQVEIAAAHAASRGTYGAPRTRAELAERGIRTSRKRVARLMRALGIIGVTRRRRVRTTTRDAQARPAPDLVDRNFGHSQWSDRLGQAQRDRRSKPSAVSAG